MCYVLVRSQTPSVVVFNQAVNNARESLIITADGVMPVPLTAGNQFGPPVESLVSSSSKSGRVSIRIGQVISKNAHL